MPYSDSAPIKTPKTDLTLSTTKIFFYFVDQCYIITHILHITLLYYYYIIILYYYAYITYYYMFYDIVFFVICVIVFGVSVL